MIVYFYRFLCGYVKIKIFGDFPERFINICAFNNIKLWNIQKEKECIYCNVSVKDYFKIRRVKKNKTVHIKLLKKRGIYFTLKPYFTRKGLLVGIIFFFVIIQFLSQFIWNIKVVGNKTLSRSDILKYCKEIGIKEGSYSRSIDTNSARLNLIMECTKLSWASFIIEGSHLTVNVLETKTVKTKDTAPANLVATKDGVVEKITVIGGKAVVKREQPVLKGDMLATGSLEYSNGTTHFVRCEGEIIARTEKIIKCNTPSVIKKSKDTGRVENRKVLNIFGCQIPLSTVPIDFPHSKEYKTDIITNGSAYCPIYITRVRYKERKSDIIKLDENKAKKFLEQKLKEKEKNELKNIDVISSADEFIVKNNSYTLIRKYHCLENIATQEKIKIINVN